MPYVHIDTYASATDIHHEASSSNWFINLQRKKEGVMKNDMVLSSEAIDRELNDSLSIVELEERFEMAEAEAELDRCRCIIL
jgi:hypothetical protein